jgi:hypothetical protein
MFGTFVEDSFVFPQGTTMKGAAVVNLLLTTLQTVNLLTPATPSVTLAGRYSSTRLHSERTRASSSCIVIPHESSTTAAARALIARRVFRIHLRVRGALRGRVAIPIH